MPKTEVYSWRLSTELKRRLEAQARRRRTSVSELVDRIVRDWLDSPADPDAEAELAYDAAQRCLGSLSGGDPARSRRVRETVRRKLRARRSSRP